MMFALKYDILPTLMPVIIWSVLSYFTAFHDFLMGFWGGLSLVGVYGINIYASYNDDIYLYSQYDFFCFYASYG